MCMYGFQAGEDELEYEEEEEVVGDVVMLEEEEEEEEQEEAEDKINQEVSLKIWHEME